MVAWPPLYVGCVTYGCLEIALATLALLTYVVYIPLSYNTFDLADEVLPATALWTVVVAFAITLIVGVHKREDGCVLAYFMMGLMRSIALLIYGVALYVFDVYYHNTEFYIIGVLIVGNSLVLWMVGAVYFRMRKSETLDGIQYTSLTENVKKEVENC